jgi:hypothetical protein
MKKLLTLLVLALMLTACAPAPTAPLAPAVVSPPAPISTPALPPPPVLEVQVQWETPDQTYDNAPWWAGQACFYGAPMLEFLPAPDYGLIYPYVGELVEKLWWGKQPLLGLCTADGQIITAPIYTALHILFDGTNSAYLLYDSTGKKEAPDDRPCMLFAIDGSWVIELEAAVFGNAFGEGYGQQDVGYLAAKKGGLWGTIGYDGEIIEPFTHETGWELYRAGFTDEQGREWHWCGGEVYMVSWLETLTQGDAEFYSWHEEIHIGDVVVPGGRGQPLGDQVYVCTWVYDEKEDRSTESVSVYDMAGNYLHEYTDGSFWDLMPELPSWVSYSTDEQTGAITTYTRGTAEHDGAPLITLLPAKISPD